MPHTRARHLEPLLKKALGLSPIVGVLGHRQVGKTTLLEALSDRYATLDLPSTRMPANKTPETWLQDWFKAGELHGIDECQLAPGLFPVLKEWVRRHKRPGQFLLSGSIRFTSRKAIQESLTGRIITLELLPMTLSELCELPLSDRLLRWMDLPDFPLGGSESVTRKSSAAARRKEFETYLEQGGLPGICFIREPKLRALKLEEQLRTLLDRDLRLVQATPLSYSTIRELLVQLARRVGEPIEYRQLASHCSISIPTVKRLIFALEAIFLIRSFPIEGTRKGFTIFFEDQGEWNWLSQGQSPRESRLLQFVFAQARAQFQYRAGETVRTFQYRSRGGALIPLCYQHPLGVLGIYPIENPEEFDGLRGSIRSFLSAYSRSKVLLLHRGDEFKRVSDRILLAPMLECL